MNRVCCFSVWLACVTCASGEPRIWTHNDGRQISAELMRMDKGGVVLLLADGRQANVAMADLSQTDRTWLQDNGASIAAAEAGWLPWDRRHLPGTVQEPLLDMNISVVKEAAGDGIYESGHFRFHTTAKLGALVMRDICRAFESTHELVRRLPWGIVPHPEEGRSKFQAELFETRDQYLATGAPRWSGGVYMTKDKVFRIPFEELGLTKAPSNKTSGYTRSGTINNDTITHEITHQMMHEYLPFAPVWLLEGTAEYTAHLPYNSGQFNVTAALAAFKEMREGGRTRPQRRRMFRSVAHAPSWIGVRELWGYTTDITRREETDEAPSGQAGTKPGRKPSPAAAEADPAALADRYYSSHALVFYFMHMDGAGDGARFKKYFDALHAEKARWTPFWLAVEAYNKAVDELRPAYDAYKKAMLEFMKKPGVRDLGDGQFSYPSDLTPPEAPSKPPEMPRPPDGTDPDKVYSKHLDVLLDGRTLVQLEGEVRAAFTKAGVSL